MDPCQNPDGDLEAPTSIHFDRCISNQFNNSIEDCKHNTVTITMTNTKCILQASFLE